LSFEITCLWLFALTYLLLMTLASKKSIRYLLPAWPTFYLLTGWAWVQLACHLSLVTRHSQFAIRNPQSAIRWLAPAITLTLLIIFAAAYHPYYLSYYNPALLGWRWAPHTLLVGWGEGLDRAADYLNRQPPARVAAWYEWLFPLYYAGQTEPVVPPENMLTADHAVLYLNQVQRDIPNPNIIDYFRTRRQPEHTVRLNGIDYAWVYPGPVAGGTIAPQPQHPLAAQFGDELQLLGFDLPNQPAGSGQPLIITLHWHVLSPPPAERFVFVRLLDAAGRVWAAADSPPLMGLWPVERWQPGTFLEDAQQLTIPAGTPPGSYRLEIGLYDPATGQPLPATGQPLGPGGGLLAGDLPVEWQPAPQLDTNLPQPANVKLSPNVALLGFTQPPPQATTGDVLPLEMGWQQRRGWLQFGQIWENYVLFDWRTASARVAEQLDPLPLPVEQWGRNSVLRSKHGVIVPPTLSGGRYELWAMLHTGSDPAGEPILLGQVDVTTPPHTFTLPSEAQPPQPPAALAADEQTQISLAGFTLNPAADALAIELFWQTSGPISERYKIFVQLLSANNQLVAQADAFPAQGARPTTGWLPGEIITDAHTLPLPPDLPAGSYRLIAGLYNPVNGQRLPLVDSAGDSILVTTINNEQ
jgi:hypothetical protein